MQKFRIAAFVTAALVVSQADATTYIVDLTLNKVAVHGSITTDGTIGTIDASNIVGYSFTFGTHAFSGDASTIDQRNMSLIATATDLTYNFVKSSNRYQWFDFDSFDYSASFCVQVSNCYNSAGPELGVFVDNSSTVYSMKETGVHSFAHIAASPAPEPATWGLMAAGFGLLGTALRRRKATAHLAQPQAAARTYGRREA